MKISLTLSSLGACAIQHETRWQGQSVWMQWDDHHYCSHEQGNELCSVRAEAL